jgi:hypothetical protein
MSLNGCAGGEPVAYGPPDRLDRQAPAKQLRAE